MLKLRSAESIEDIDSARGLFLEYEKWLGVDLCFQNFEQELASLPGEYAPPFGRLILASYEGVLAGCVAVRAYEKKHDVCEMKRLFVREAFRGFHIGRALSQAAIAEGRSAGYSVMRLDTLERMNAARALYRSLGFKEIPAYRYNPIAGAVYMELSLKSHT